MQYKILQTCTFHAQSPIKPGDAPRTAESSLGPSDKQSLSPPIYTFVLYEATRLPRYRRNPNAIFISSHRHLILMKFAIAYQPSLQFSATCTRPNQTYNIYVEGSRRLQHTRPRWLHASPRFHSAFLLSPYALTRRDIDGVECRSTPGDDCLVNPSLPPPSLPFLFLFFLASFSYPLFFLDSLSSFSPCIYLLSPSSSSISHLLSLSYLPSTSTSSFPFVYPCASLLHPLSIPSPLSPISLAQTTNRVPLVVAEGIRGTSTVHLILWAISHLTNVQMCVVFPPG